MLCLGHILKLESIKLTDGLGQRACRGKESSQLVIGKWVRWCHLLKRGRLGKEIDVNKDRNRG